MKRPSIYQYTSYREYIKIYVQYLQSTSNGDFSFRKFGKKAGFSSPAVLPQIIAGKSALSPRSASKVAKGFGLTTHEALFLDLLIQYSDSKSVAQKEAAYREMIRYQSFRKAHPLAKSQLAYYTKWYMPVIREMVGLQSFKEDPDWIASKIFPDISAKEAEEALKDLLQLGLIARKNGRLVQSDAMLASGDDIRSLELLGFHRSMLHGAIKALEGLPMEEREISSLTITLPKAEFGVLKKSLVRFRKEVFEKYGETRASDEIVCQLNIQLFPLTKLTD